MAINCKQLKLYVIEPALKSINLYSESAVNLLLGTCAVESDFGSLLIQEHGPARGIYQMEEKTFNYLFDKFNKSYMNGFFNIYKESASCDEMIGNLYLATVMCRLKYLDIKEPLPQANDIEALAHYWKKYYNTELGKGKVSDFIEKYHKYVTC